MPKKNDSTVFFPLEDEEALIDKPHPETPRVEDCLVLLNSTSKKSQHLVLGVFSLMYFFLGFQSGTYVFMFLAPVFSLPETGQTLPVSEVEACHQKSFHTESWFSSISTEEGLYCESSGKRDSFEFVVLLFGSLTSAVFLLLADRLGRKVVILVNWLLVLVGSVCVLLIESVGFKVFGLVLLWAYLDTVLASCTILSNELLVNPLRNLSSVCFNCIHSLGGIVGTFLAFYLGDYRRVVLVYSLGFSVASLLLLLLVPKSPSFLLSKGRFEEFRVSLQSIVSLNAVPPEVSEKVDHLAETLIQGKQLGVINTKCSRRPPTHNDPMTLKPLSSTSKRKKTWPASPASSRTPCSCTCAPTCSSS